MKIIITLILLACSQLTAEDKDKDKDKVENFVNQWVQTFNVNTPEKQSKFYHQSERTEMLVSSGFWHKGFKEVTKAYEDDQKQLRYFNSKLKGLSINKIGKSYFVSFEHLFKIKILQDNSKYQIHIRTTMALATIKGELKIVQEHSSSIRGVARVTKLTD